MRADFKWSPSSLKAAEKCYATNRDPQCPERWRGEYRDKEFRSFPSQAMMFGSYFEALAIGSTVSGEGPEKYEEIFKDLSKGKADLERVKKQAERIKGMLYDESHPEYLGWKVTRTQWLVENENQKGVIDIAGTENGEPFIADLKLTGDVWSTFGDFAWGNAEAVDYIQMLMYAGLIPKKVKVYVLIVDYSTSMNIKLIEVDVTDLGIEEKDMRIANAQTWMESWDESFERVPSSTNCDGCQLACPMKVEKGKIIKSKVYR